MNNNRKLLSVTLAAGAAGVAAFTLANSAFVASLPGDVILGVGASLAIVGFAVYDYSRRYQPLALPDRVMRPKLPLVAPRRVTCTPCKDRAA